MTEPGEQMDQILHALAADENVRIAAISAYDMVCGAKTLHGLSRVATAALGRQLMMTAMMASQLKNEGDRVSTILRGDGPAGNMVCTGAIGPVVKGYTSEPAVELPPTPEGKLDVGGYVGRTGRLTVVRDLPVGDPYVGVCNLISGEIAVDFAQYFTVSEQQPSLVYLGVRIDAASGEVRAASGVLVQPLPGCPDETIDDLQARAEAITTLTHRLDDGQTLETAAADLFSGLDFHVVKRFSPAYRCDCTRERIERALISVGAEELQDMIERDGGAEVKCHFCNAVYEFTATELSDLLRMAQSEDNGQNAT